MPRAALPIPSVLVCFAVTQEARFFGPALDWPNSVRVCVTGMGPRNALAALKLAVAAQQPDHVLTCGFAGGLNPSFPQGAALFSADASATVRVALVKSGATPAHFHCASAVAVTAADKARLRIQTNADAVEMESGVIRDWCTQQGISSTTLRVVSDAAQEDLPLDFNRLMTRDDSIDLLRLASHVALAPWRIPALLRLQKATLQAARTLAFHLAELLSKNSLAHDPKR